MLLLLLLLPRSAEDEEGGAKEPTPALRAEIDAEAAREGWPAMHAKLALLDPSTAARLHTTDSQRLQRALEICRLSGRPMSELLAGSARQQPPYDLLSIGLLPAARAVLHERIAHRFDEMLLAGLDEEVRMLRAKYRLDLNLPSMRCVGYRQVWAALDDDAALAPGSARWAAMRDAGIAATRQLAKRQLTWLRSMAQRHVVACDQPGALQQALDLIEAALRTERA